MSRGDHTLKGLLFVAVCAVIAAIIYLSLRPASPDGVLNQTVNDNANARADELEAQANSIDAVNEQNVGNESRSDPVPEEAAEQPPTEWMSQPSFDGYKFADFPVQPYEGGVTLPRFVGDQRRFANFRTRIVAATSQGPQFAGSMAVTSIGCGTECVVYNLTDVRTGLVFDWEPAGTTSDDDLVAHEIWYQKDSALMFERYRVNETCVYNVDRWNGTTMENLKSVTRPVVEYECP